MYKQVLIFCGGGVYPHYYIIEWHIPQAVVLADCLQDQENFGFSVHDSCVSVCVCVCVCVCVSASVCVCVCVSASVSACV